jgi:PAS domain S-box-containing protein
LRKRPARRNVAPARPRVRAGAAPAGIDIGQLLTRSLDPDVIAQRVADALVTLFHARSAGVYGLDPRSGALVSVAIAPPRARDAGQPASFPSGAGAVGLALREAGPIVTRNLLTDARLVYPPDMRASLAASPNRALLAVPLLIGGRPIGALSIADVEGRTFDASEVALAGAFADQAAVALENAQIYQRAEERSRRLTSLAALTRLVTSATTSGEVFRGVAEAATVLLKARMTWVFVDDPARGVLRPDASFGVSPEEAALMAGFAPAYGQGVAGAVFASRRAEFIQDVQRDPRWLNRTLVENGGLHACAAIPLLTRERAAGVLIVLFGRRADITQEEQELASLLADQAAIAIQNARLYEEAGRQRRETEFSAEIARAISASLDLDIVLQRITDGAKDLAGSDTAMIALREGDAEAVTGRYRVGSLDPSERMLTVEPGKGIGGQALLTGRAVRTDDYAQDARFGKEYVRVVRREGVVAAMVVPIKLEARVVGILYVANRAPRPFTDRDEAVLVRLAEGAAIAIRNAQLYARERESERRYRSLFENANDPIVTFALDGTITGVNPEAERALGYTRDELVGHHYREFLVPASVAAIADRARRALAGEKVPPTFEVVGVRRDDAEITAEGRMSVMRDAAGAVTGWQVIYRDTTERQRAERALRASEERYRTLVEGSIQGIHIHRDWVTLFANTAWARMMGYASPREVIGIDARCWIAPRELARIEGYAAARARGEPAPARYEMQALRRDGTPLWAELQVSSIVWDGEPATQTAMLDITERKRAEQALRESSEFLRQVIASARSGIIVYDRELRYTVWNPLMEELTGLRAADVVGRYCLDLFPFLREQGIYALLARARAGETVSSPDFRYTVPSTGRTGWVSGRYGPLLDANGRIIGVISTVRDVTERRRAEEALRQSEEQLRQAQKMEAVGRLAGGIAHDFNNLLTVITGRSELLLRRLPPDDPVRRDLEQIKKTADRAATLTKQLLAFSRKQMLQPKVLDLNGIVAGVAQMLQRLIGEDIDLVTLLDPNLGAVLVDPAQIEQIILNLAVNARDAMPQGGRLSIETANIDLGAGFAAANPGASAGPYVLLQVSDTGSGMNPDVQAHIFEPFFTTKDVGKGTGLGLATVYGIVKQHDGCITVESAPGAGATFRVYLKRADEAAAPAEPSLAATRVPQGSETILLVEDEDGLRELAREILTAGGYKVLVAAGPGDALGVARRHGGPIHLLLTDVVMPQMSGRELVERLAPEQPEMKVLYMSGYAADAIVRRGVLDPGTVLLQKPFSPDALTRKVREVLSAPQIPR